MSHEIITLVSAVLIGIIALFRDKAFLNTLHNILVKPRHPKDVKTISELEEQNRELIKQHDINAALEAMLDEIDSNDPDALKRMKATKRILSKGAGRH